MRWTQAPSATRASSTRGSARMRAASVAGVILAGGEGTRLRPLTTLTAKPVVTLVDRPFIVYMLEWLRRHGVDDVSSAAASAPRRARRTRRRLALRLRLRYVEESEPLAPPVRSSSPPSISSSASSSATATSSPTSICTPSCARMSEPPRWRRSRSSRSRPHHYGWSAPPRRRRDRIPGEAEGPVDPPRPGSTPRLRDRARGARRDRAGRAVSIERRSGDAGRHASTPSCQRYWMDIGRRRLPAGQLRHRQRAVEVDREGSHDAAAIGERCEIAATPAWRARDPR